MFKSAPFTHEVTGLTNSYVTHCVWMYGNNFTS